MLSQLLRQLFSSFGIFFRTIKAFFTRRIMSVAAYIHRITNFSRQATKVATASVQGVTAAVKKPTKRSDYIETERLFISKSFLILAAVVLVLLGLLAYYVAWPFILSHFLTARFYREDKRIPDWSGKVIVYADKDKTVPMYSGRLEDGVLQGTGMEYDEDGLLVYEGGFVDGVRSGSGTGYEAGVLLYEGTYADGVYEGVGTLYQDGLPDYQGMFSGGLPNGMGTDYDMGVKCYQGAFVDGVYEGEGAAYDGDGTLRYKGSFSEGLYDGEGSAYDEEGDLRYRGSFAKGLYDGPGTVYLKNGDTIASDFSAGKGGGVIQWYKNGRLWYDGGADDLVPDGFGTLYAANGKAIYAGEMDRGTLDGAWMLGLTAEELREAFGMAAVTDNDREKSGGFLIVNHELHLTVLCTFQQEDTAPGAFRIWFTPEAGSGLMSLLPWADREEAERWASVNRADLFSFRRSHGSTYLPEGGIGGDWEQTVFSYRDHGCSMVSAEAESAPFSLIWAQPGGLDVGAVDDAVNETVAQAQETLDSLLEAMDGIGGASGEEDGAADPADVERLLGLMLTPRDACDLMDALADCYAYGQSVAAMEASRPLLEQNVSEQQGRLDRGQGSQDELDAAQEKLDSLDSSVLQYRVAQEQAKLVAEKLTGLKIDGYDLAAVLKVIDVTAIDASGLYEAAAAYAGEMAAGRYEVDTAQIELDVKSRMLDLALAYENVRTVRQALEKAQASLEEVTQAYSMGTAEKSALYGAQCAVNDAAAALFQTTAVYTKLVNRLNDLSGGWLAEQYDWFAEPFGVLYDMAIRQSADEAEAAKQESAGGDTAGGDAAEENPGGEENTGGDDSGGESGGAGGAGTSGETAPETGEPAPETGEPDSETGGGESSPAPEEEGA